MFFLTLFYTGLALLGLYLLAKHKKVSRKYCRFEMLSQFREYSPPADWVSIDTIRKQLIEKKSKIEKQRVKSLSKGQHIILPEDKENFSPISEPFDSRRNSLKQLDPMVPEFVPVSLNPDAPAFNPRDISCLN